MSQKKKGKVISVFSSKGGCGKSFYSTYIPLGILKINPEEKILILDLCKNSSVAKEFGISEVINNSVFDWYSSKGQRFKQCVKRFGNTNIYYMASNNDVDKLVEWTNENIRVNREYFLRKLIEPLKDYFDYIFIDNHPSQNDDKSLYSIVAADTIVLATTAELSSMNATIQDINMVKEVQEAVPHSLNYFIATNKVEYNKGDKRHIETFYDQLINQGVKAEQLLPPIRYATTIKRNKLYQIFQDSKLRENRYVKNVLNDVFVHAREVMSYV